MADGRKLKPYVLFKGVRSIAELDTPGVVVALSKNGWMNEALTKDWINRVWGALNFGRRLLVWDAYKCHITASVRSCVDKQTNSDVSIIPGGLTSHLQPADVSWNKPFKAAYKEKYSQSMATGPKTYTATDNVRAPSKALFLQWVRECWEALPSEIIRKSFRACGIAVNIDGKEDEEDGVVADARDAIRRDSASLDTASTDAEDLDPFEGMEDDEDEDELKANEVLLEDC